MFQGFDNNRVSSATVTRTCWGSRVSGFPGLFGLDIGFMGGEFGVQGSTVDGSLNQARDLESETASPSPWHGGWLLLCRTLPGG